MWGRIEKAPAGESPSLDRLSLNRTPSRYEARVVTQSHPGLDALTLTRSRAPSQNRISPTPIHSHFSSPTQTWIYCRNTRRRRRRRRRFPASLAAIPFALLMPRHVLSNTYTHIKIRTVNPNKREDVHSVVCASICVRIYMPDEIRHRRAITPS